LTSLGKAYETDDEFYKTYGSLFEESVTPDPDPVKKRKMTQSGGYVVCTIVSSIKTDHPKAVVSGNMITLNGFGRIFLGELLISSVSRRLTLLRLKLGSPIEGDVVCGDIESNGTILV
jgi:hypothetical protein